MVAYSVCLSVCLPWRDWDGREWETPCFSGRLVGHGASELKFDFDRGKKVGVAVLGWSWVYSHVLGISVVFVLFCFCSFFFFDFFLISPSCRLCPGPQTCLSVCPFVCVMIFSSETDVSRLGLTELTVDCIAVPCPGGIACGLMVSLFLSRLMLMQ